MKQAIITHQAPAAIGCYSQAIRAGNTLYLSGQIPLQPQTMELVAGDIKAQIKQVFDNLKAVAEAAGTDLDAIVRLTVYLIDIAHLPVVNEMMKNYFTEPYPARTSIQVAALPKGASVEVDAVIVFAA
jgi:reactive intermediate/imine deaminase